MGWRVVEEGVQGILGNLKGFRGWVISLIKHHLVREELNNFLCFP